MFAALLLLSLVLQAPEPLEDGIVTEATPACVGSNQGPLPSAGSFQIEPTGIGSSVVAAAMGAWNDPSCNSGGTAFPVLQLGPGATSQVSVTYQGGFDPANNFACGDHQGSHITLYGQAKDPVTGQVRPCSDQVGNLEHEFGHLFGLVDQTTANCSGYIMSQAAFTPSGQEIGRFIHPAECAEANALNITPTERNPPPPPPPAQCPPDCICPPTCQTGCNANGVCQDDPCVAAPTLPQCGDGGDPGDPGGICGDEPCDDGIGRFILPSPSPPPPHVFGASATPARWSARGCGREQRRAPGLGLGR